MKIVLCDGDRCAELFQDAHPGNCPVGWVRVEAFSPGQRTIGHMCPGCWNNNPINFTKRMPELLKGMPLAHA